MGRPPTLAFIAWHWGQSPLNGNFNATGGSGTGWAFYNLNDTVAKISMPNGGIFDCQDNVYLQGDSTSSGNKFTLTSNNSAQWWCEGNWTVNRYSGTATTYYDINATVNLKASNKQFLVQADANWTQEHGNGMYFTGELYANNTLHLNDGAGSSPYLTVYSGGKLTVTSGNNFYSQLPIYNQGTVQTTGGSTLIDITGKDSGSDGYYQTGSGSVLSLKYSSTLKTEAGGKIDVAGGKAYLNGSSFYGVPALNATSTIFAGGDVYVGDGTNPAYANVNVTGNLYVGAATMHTYTESYSNDGVNPLLHGSKFQVTAGNIDLNYGNAGSTEANSHHNQGGWYPVLGQKWSLYTVDTGSGYAFSGGRDFGTVSLTGDSALAEDYAGVGADHWGVQKL